MRKLTSSLLATALALGTTNMVSAQVQTAATARQQPGPASARPAEAPAAEIPAAASPDSSITTRIPFSRLGVLQPIHLTGVRDSGSVGVGVRLDRIVTGARLHLEYTYSPALLPSLSSIRVLFNKQVVAVAPVEKQDPGRTHRLDVVLDPRMFTSYNQITLQLAGQYTIDQCQDLANSGIWADISPSSDLTLDEEPITLPDNLSLLPAPFFDPRDNTRLVLPFMLGAAPDDERLRSAGILASMFGKLAGYRGAGFPVVNTFPLADNAVLLATPADLPPSLHVGQISGPTIMVADNPAAPGRKILLVLGRDNTQIQTAVYGLVMHKALFSGPRATIDAVDIGPPRRPYDAPNWISTDGPVQFRDIVADPAQLQAAGSAPDPIRIPISVPADMFDWSGRGIPLKLKYRNTAPSVVNDSMLSVDINGLLVKSYRLRPESITKNSPDVGALRLLTLDDDGSSTDSLIDIPAFRIGATNELQLTFSLDSQKRDICGSIANNPSRVAIDPGSTIDFSGLVHYTRMPNLAYFVNSGYPFTRLADLADTAIVIPDHPDAADIQAMLEILGRMGDWTGLPALRVGVMRSSELEAPLDKDLIVIGSGNTGSLFKGWDDVSPLRITKSTAAGGVGGHYMVTLVQSSEKSPDKTQRSMVRLEEDAGLGAIVGMKSPFHESRSIVAFVGTDHTNLANVYQAVADPGASTFIRGDLAIVKGSDVQAMRIGVPYHSGHLPWYARVWMVASQHPLLLAALSVLAGILIAMGLFLGLQSVAARRRGG